MLIPETHAILEILTSIPNYQHNLKRIVKLTSSKYSNGSILDIGANIGYTLALIKEQTNNTVICIEGDPKYFDILSKNAGQFSNVQLIRKFIGNPDSSDNFVSIKENGTLRIVENGIGSKSETIRFIRPAEVFSQFKDISLIKIDTDGFDLQIIQSSLEQLGGNPIIFFEYDPKFFLPYTTDWKLFFLEVEKIGYSSMLIYDHLGGLITCISDFSSSTLYGLHSYIAEKRNILPYYDICLIADKDKDILSALLADENRTF
jgi:FkbM family methyltransferase